MTTYQSITHPDKIDDKRISKGDFSYINTRNRFMAFDFLIREFKKSGLTQAQLARRLGTGPDQVSRMFRYPSNVTIDTISEYLYAICGAAVKFQPSYPNVSTETIGTQKPAEMAMELSKDGPKKDQYFDGDTSSASALGQPSTTVFFEAKAA